MSHYFLEDKTLKNEDKIIKFHLLDKEITLHSNNGLFSKSRLDKGSEFFISELVKLPLKNENILDYGSGNGVIGITLNLFFKDLKVSYCDSNLKALEVTKLNLDKYALTGDLYSDKDILNLKEETFDYIYLNPPIRSGKENIFNMYKNAYRLLKTNKEFYIVIRKDLGMLSHKAFLEKVFKEVVILSKKKGYYILKMVK